MFDHANPFLLMEVHVQQARDHKGYELAPQDRPLRLLQSEIVTLQDLDKRQQTNPSSVVFHVATDALQQAFHTLHDDLSTRFGKRHVSTLFDYIRDAKYSDNRLAVNASIIMKACVGMRTQQQQTQRSRQQQLQQAAAAIVHRSRCTVVNVRHALIVMEEVSSIPNRLAYVSTTISHVTSVWGQLRDTVMDGLSYLFQQRPQQQQQQQNGPFMNGTEHSKNGSKSAPRRRHNAADPSAPMPDTTGDASTSSFSTCLGPSSPPHRFPSSSITSVRQPCSSLQFHSGLLDGVSNFNSLILVACCWPWLCFASVRGCLKLRSSAGGLCGLGSGRRCCGRQWKLPQQQGVWYGMLRWHRWGSKPQCCCSFCTGCCGLLGFENED